MCILEIRCGLLVKKTSNILPREWVGLEINWVHPRSLNVDKNKFWVFEVEVRLSHLILSKFKSPTKKCDLIFLLPEIKFRCCCISLFSMIAKA